MNFSPAFSRRRYLPLSLPPYLPRSGNIINCFRLMCKRPKPRQCRWNNATEDRRKKYRKIDMCDQKPWLNGCFVENVESYNHKNIESECAIVRTETKKKNEMQKKPRLECLLAFSIVISPPPPPVQFHTRMTTKYPVSFYNAFSIFPFHLTYIHPQCRETKWKWTAHNYHTHTHGFDKRNTFSTHEI